MSMPIPILNLSVAALIPMLKANPAKNFNSPFISIYTHHPTNKEYHECVWKLVLLPLKS